jgi:hypothetical protein
MSLNHRNINELINEVIQFVETEPTIINQIIIAFLKDIKIILTSDTKKVEKILKKYDNILTELENFFKE